MRVAPIALLDQPGTRGDEPGTPGLGGGSLDHPPALSLSH